MKANFKCTNPGAIEMSMTITMSLNDWTRLKEQLSSQYPAWKLAEEISSMVLKAQANFQPDSQSEPS